MNTFLNIYSWILIAGSVYMSLIAITNFVFFKIKSRTPKSWEMKEEPKVSILIPARNEESRIKETLDHALTQNYKNYDVNVLDDNSTDKTGKILKTYMEKYENLNVIKGNHLGKGWKGKPHALQQLIDQTDSDYVICIDADISISPDLIRWTVYKMNTNKVDCLAAWPQHRFKEFKEYTITPTIYTLSTFLLPMFLIPLVKNQYFAFAMQFIAYKRTSLDKIHGYEAVKNVMNEDNGMARSIKAAGMKMICLDGKNHISGLMYDGFPEAVKGLERSISDFFNQKLYPLVILSIFMATGIVLPIFFTIGTLVTGHPSGIRFLIGFILFSFGWILSMIDRRLHWISWISYPVNYSAIIFLAFRSWARQKSGKGFTWKGRKVV